MRQFIPAILGLTILLGQASATNITILGDLADTQVQKTGIFSGDPTQNQGQNGKNGGFDFSMVYVFRLPTLGPNQVISDASFSFVLIANNANFDTDLYGLSYRTLPGVLASDWFSGPSDANNTLIQSAVFPPLTAPGRIGTSLAGGTALANFLNAQYAAGATGNDYVFLRLSTRATNPLNGNTNFYYTADVAFFLANSQGQSTLPRWQEQFSPMLNVTIAQADVPEPTTATSVILGVALVVIGRLRAC